MSEIESEDNESGECQEAGASPGELSHDEVTTIMTIPVPGDIGNELGHGGEERVGEKNTNTIDSPTPTVSATTTGRKAPISYAALHIKHRAYTVQFKLKVLDWYYANGQNKRQAADHFGLDRKRVRDWLKIEPQLRAAPECYMHRIRSKPGCPPQYEELDKTVLEWYKEQAEQGVRISDRVLRTKALELAPQLGLQDTFKGSPNWAASWRRRNRHVLIQYLAPEDRPREATSNNFEEDLQQQYGLNSESDFATVAEAITGMTDIFESGTESPANHSTHTPIGRARGESSSQPRASLQTLIDALGKQSPSTSTPTPSLIREHEHWLALIEQTVDSLNTEFTSKISQIKLLLQHLKGSMESTKDTCQGDQSATSQHNQIDNNTGKRAGASTSNPPTAAKRARK